MSRTAAVSAWEETVSRHLPGLRRPQAAGLALWSLGIVLAQRCGQTSVVALVADLVGQSEGTVRQRLREWCYAAEDKAGSRRGIHRRTLEVTTCFAPPAGLGAELVGERGGSSAGAGAGCQQSGRALHGAGAQCALPWLRDSGGVGGGTRPGAGGMATALGRVAPALARQHSRRLAGGGAGGSGPVCALALSGDCGVWLAPVPAPQQWHARRWRGAVSPRSVAAAGARSRACCRTSARGGVGGWSALRAVRSPGPCWRVGSRGMRRAGSS